MLPTVDTVRALAERCSNWGRWGPEDELGTLNHIRPDDVVAASGLVRSGRVFSLAIPLDENGPQTGGFGRFNPIHLMIRDGNAAATGTTVRDFYGGQDRWIRGTDDLLILPLQSGTQWDSLAHIVFENRIYNGYDATSVGSKGAIRNDIANARDRVVGRGVLLDLPRYHGRPWLEPGEPIQRRGSRGVRPRPGGHGRARRHRAHPDRPDGAVPRGGGWGAYAGGAAPGLALDAGRGSSTTSWRRWPATRGASRSCPTRPRMSSSRSTSS